MQIFIQSGLGNFYYDRVAVGDSRIGLVGDSPQPAPASRPCAPANFKVGH